MAKKLQDDEPIAADVDAIVPASDNADHERMKLDEMTKEQFFDMTPEQVIRFTNKNLGTDFPLDAEFHWLPTETVNNKTLRRSDIEYSIAEHRFHIEFESGKNGDLSLRMFEYGGRSAWANRWKDADGFEHTRYRRNAYSTLRAMKAIRRSRKRLLSTHRKTALSRKSHISIKQSA